MPFWLRGLAGALVVAAAVVVFAPASLLDRWLAQRTHDQLRIADARGLWWNGRGVVTVSDGSARVPIAWRFDLRSLRGPAMQLTSVGSGLSPTLVRARDDAFEIHDLRVRIPATVVRALDPRLRAVALGGDITVEAPSLLVGGASPSGSLAARWERARIVAAAAVAALGTVSLNAAPAGGSIAGTLTNAGGDIALDGTLRERDGVVEATLTLKPDATASDSVRRLLPLLGTPDGAGNVRIDWRGR